MNTKLFSLVLAFVLTTIMSSAQVPTFLSSSLIPSNYSACTNPITMGFGVTAVDFNIEILLHSILILVMVRIIQHLFNILPMCMIHCLEQLLTLMLMQEYTHLR